MLSSAYRVILTVRFCAVLPVSTSVTAEIFGVRALLSLGVGERSSSLVSSACLVLLQCSGPEEAISASWQAWQTPGKSTPQGQGSFCPSCYKDITSCPVDVKCQLVDSS